VDENIEMMRDASQQEADDRTNSKIIDVRMRMERSCLVWYVQYSTYSMYSTYSRRRSYVQHDAMSVGLDRGQSVSNKNKNESATGGRQRKQKMMNDVVSVIYIMMSLHPRTVIDIIWELKALIKIR
jgi:hypothetical protein